MRTTLNLPEKLLTEAMKVSRSRTKTGAIVKALEDLVRKARIAKIKEYRGKIDLDMNLDQLRNRR